MTAKRTSGPFRLITPSTSSKSGYISESSDTSVSSAPPRSPSVVSSASSTTSEDESIPRRQEIPADDTDAYTDTNLASKLSRRRGKFKGNYFDADHFLAPPTPEQLYRQRKRKPRKLLYTFVRQHKKLEQKPELFVDPKVKSFQTNRIKNKIFQSVDIPEIPLHREDFAVNSAEFKPVKVLQRVYKPTLRRRRVMDIGEGIGIGGYVIRFADGHEYCVYPC
jgi:hypothetical protein